MEEPFKVPIISEIKKPKPENQAPSNEQQQDVITPYKEPKWSGCAEEYYAFEVLKNGQIVEEIKNLENKSFWVFGRLPQNDITAAHPTISRFHCVLQYRPPQEIEKEEDADENKDIEKGWFIYDLGEFS